MVDTKPRDVWSRRKELGLSLSLREVSIDLWLDLKTYNQSSIHHEDTQTRLGTDHRIHYLSTRLFHLTDLSDRMSEGSWRTVYPLGVSPLVLEGVNLTTLLRVQMDTLTKTKRE